MAAALWSLLAVAVFVSAWAGGASAAHVRREECPHLLPSIASPPAASDAQFEAAFLDIAGRAVSGAVPRHLIAQMGRVYVDWARDECGGGAVGGPYEPSSSADSAAVVATAAPSVVGSDGSDCAALGSVFDGLSGVGWKNRTGWNMDRSGVWTDCCGAFGVQCSDDGRVTGLSLSNNGLSGIIPEAIGDLRSLRTL